MNYSIIRYVLAWVLTFEGGFLLLPTLVSLCYGEREGWTYAVVAVVCLLIGGMGCLKKPKSNAFYSKEGFVSVSLSWILLSLVGALPICLTGEIPIYLDALFEITSGFTTTGASILADVEALSYTSLFWRSFTHWVGGMGVLVFIMAILPLAGGTNMHLMRAESPGPVVGKLVPKVRSTAMILYGIYFVFTVIQVIALLCAGMNLLESLTLTFGTVGTGGFGITNTSIASYSPAVQVIITIFMLICAINFTVYYLILVKKPKEALWYDELRFFLLIVLGTTLMITFDIRGDMNSFGEALRHALFQVASVVSSTGYATLDYNLWSSFAKTLIVLLMLMGACAGSTGGGFKVSRVMILLKAIKNEIMSILHPRSVRKVRSNGKVVSEETVKKVLVYLAIYTMIAMVTVLILSLDGYDMETTITATIACFNNVGPGLGVVGPTGNFASFRVLSKIVLIFDMLVGRLEIFPMMILLVPATWNLPTRLADIRKNKEIEDTL